MRGGGYIKLWRTGVIVRKGMGRKKTGGPTPWQKAQAGKIKGRIENNTALHGRHTGRSVATGLKGKRVRGKRCREKKWLSPVKEPVKTFSSGRGNGKMPRGPVSQ